MGRISALDGIAPQVYKNDHTRQLLASSPYGGDAYGSITKGTSHTTNFLRMIFDKFVYDDCSDYKEFMEQFVSRFISEEGVFGAIMRPSMLKFMTEQDLLKDDDEEMLVYHTRTNPSMENHIFSCVKEFSRKALGDFADSEDKFFKYKYIQYEWTRVSFENVRRNLGYCNGLIFWMYNDCWPAAMGWSFVDYYLLPKHAYYAFKRGSKHITGSVVPKDDIYNLVITTDNETVTDLLVKAYVIKGGDIVDSLSLATKTAGYGTVSVDIPYGYDKDAVILCDIEYSGGKDRCFYKDGTLDLRSCDELIKVEKIEDGIEIRALGYVHVIELEGECEFEDNCFSLLKGESRRVNIGNLSNGDFTVRAYTL
jgi:beta-mannosidase